jgi:hypothetical protein
MIGKVTIERSLFSLRLWNISFLHLLFWNVFCCCLLLPCVRLKEFRWIEFELGAYYWLESWIPLFFLDGQGNREIDWILSHEMFIMASFVQFWNWRERESEEV